MNIVAQFESRNTSDGIKIFRHSTECHSKLGPGKVIGLVYMLNPGDARPISEELFHTLQTSEYKTIEPVATAPDKTLSKVTRLINSAFEYNNITLPDRYTIHIENLFNLREKDSDKAIRLAKKLTGVEDLMFKQRPVNNSYKFVWIAWGSQKINSQRQKEIMSQFPDAIIVKKLKHRGEIRDVTYPVHPLYMNTDYFIEASRGKIRV
ncbi:hypothetical protein [Scopulibacillus cellulosilyticus]|uniref:Uncharacterized protein n=1 Tax=Scopulibacillus cellulosilyticus TaxID=2665665 RepID=A0ABW2PV67_9BACL